LAYGKIVSLKGRPCEEEQNSLAYFRSSFSPPPARSRRSFFSDSHSENLVKLLKVKFTKVTGLFTF
jgi:hypothetical protein